MIVVLGSVNLDVVATVERHPRPGETVMARSHVTHHGGKGGNQAVAAARLGSEVAFIGCVGSDQTGLDLRAGLEDEGVDCDALSVAGDVSGMAWITVDEHGENSIVVGPGANARVSPGPEHRSLLETASVVLMQLEVPLDAVAAAATMASGTVVLNAAPARSLSSRLLDSIDVLIVNEHELRQLAGSTDPTSARALGVPVVVLTLGERGAQVVTTSDIAHVTPPSVDVRDTTGAGDAFCGAFVSGLDDGLDVFECASRGVVAGSLATTKLGARTGMPDRARLESAIARRR